MSNTDSIDVFERLAAALEALPHGFPRTKSGVEMKLINMAFTAEEVSLAGQLTRFPETAAEIAKRAGMDEEEVTIQLEKLIPRRLVRIKSKGMAAPGMAPTAEGEKKYRLGQFLVGWYEAGMRLLDKEFAELFEQYVIEGGGEKILSPRPGVLGVVPVRGSLSPKQMKVMEPHLDIDAHFKRHDRFLVIDCVCKKEQEDLEHFDCKFPMKRCGFVGLPPQTPLGPTVLNSEDANKLLYKMEDLGHVHLAFYGFTMSADEPQFVGTCNCDSCCCGILHLGKRAGLSETAQRSNYRAQIDEEKCIACGLCIKRCPMDAISERKKEADKKHGKSFVTRDLCIGCGVCVIKCPVDAIVMEPVSEEEWFHTPASIEEWEERRIAYLEAEKNK